jgi:phenylalanyl-tRNA synthetase beta chain
VCSSDLVLVDGKAIGFVGELHPRWRQAYDLPQAPVVFELDWDAVLQRPLPKFASVSKYQAAERDIAVIVKESVTHDALVAAAMAAPTNGTLRSAVVFDVFRAGKNSQADWLAAGEKSVAIRLQFLNEAAAHTDESLESARQAVLQQLASSVGARLRG